MMVYMNVSCDVRITTMVAPHHGYMAAEPRFVSVA
eukprot:CAMPEP_0204041740 /NCGR_PEP_ID=MMETSP0360-20130528/95541_1 /ASSEMBLY_ACC=CAM_ASM_000342 /TAXON_ID=268821 /ORGANISM="Scrippsiella Hangoei, Strain SHTV-5" /LENGTH=34 /DNA_ID= /DNA_START= /DNA_END= /DNA_ORIENTATION=